MRHFWKKTAAGICCLTLLLGMAACNKENVEEKNPITSGVTATVAPTSEPEATKVPEEIAEPEATKAPEEVAEPEATKAPEEIVEPEPTKTPCSQSRA